MSDPAVYCVVEERCDVVEAPFDAVYWRCTVDRLSFRLDGDPKRGEVSIVGDVYVETSSVSAPPAAATLAAEPGAPAGLDVESRPVVIVSAPHEGGEPAAVLELCHALAGGGFLAVTCAADAAGRALPDDLLDRVTTAVFERMLPARERTSIYRIGVAALGASSAAALRHAARDSRVKALAVVNASADTFPARAPERLPLLVVHGERNERAPIDGARALYFAAGLSGAMEMLAGAGHDLAPPERAAAADAVVRFFKTRL